MAEKTKEYKNKKRNKRIQIQQWNGYCCPDLLRASRRRVLLFEQKCNCWTWWELDSMILTVPSNSRYSVIPWLQACSTTVLFDPFCMVVGYLFSCSMAHILRRDHNSWGVPAWITHKWDIHACLLLNHILLLTCIIFVPCQRGCLQV